MSELAERERAVIHRLARIEMDEIHKEVQRERKIIHRLVEKERNGER